MKIVAAEPLGGGELISSLSGSNLLIVIAIGALAIVALIFGLLLRSRVLAADNGTLAMQNIAEAVQEGATAFLNRQIRTLVVFVALVFALLFLLPGESGVRIGRSVFFVLGAGFSIIIGWFGMSLATHANVRVAAAARNEGRDAGMWLALRTGGAVGMVTVGLGLLGATVVVMIYAGNAPAVLEGFGFGAALLAMFMRVGGGIFTKAADVGADLVGKVEAGIPEDDPRNAATIADNVGDNVGDCAGMAADLFESYAVTLVAALILGQAAFGEAGLVFPLLIPAVGVITAAIGIVITRPQEGKSGLSTINRGFYLSSAIAIVGCAIIAFIYLPSSFADMDGVPSQIAAMDANPQFLVIGAMALGIVLAGIILALTGYFTDTNAAPTQNVARTALTGPATVVLAGIGVGFESAVYKALVIAGAVYAAFLLGGGSITLSLFLIAIAGCGLLTTVGIIVAMDTFGPVSDNAQGIGEMSGDVHGEAADALTELDAVGNTTKAVTKGIAIATAVLAACALFGSYTDTIARALASAGSALDDISGAYEIVSPETLVGVIAGGAVVFLFSGLTTDAVTRAAGAVVYEVRRQFAERPGIMTFDEKPEYGKVVDICTKDSQRELATPGLLAALAPVVIGFGLGFSALAGFLGGAISTGLLMAIFLANAGGSWDNAKKIVEDGAHGGKGSPAHEATIIGDTVGDPFKDTAGPAINPLIKVMNLVALLIAPAVISLTFGAGENVFIRVAISLTALAIIVGAMVYTRSRHAADDQGDASTADLSAGADDAYRAESPSIAHVGSTATQARVADYGSDHLTGDQGTPSAKAQSIDITPANPRGRGGLPNRMRTSGVMSGILQRNQQSGSSRHSTSSRRPGEPSGLSSNEQGQGRAGRDSVTQDIDLTAQADERTSSTFQTRGQAARSEQVNHTVASEPEQRDTGRDDSEREDRDERPFP